MGKPIFFGPVLTSLGGIRGQANVDKLFLSHVWALGFYL